jgi:hypothetical protein
VKTGTNVEGVFSTPRLEERVQELKVTFDTPPTYGKGLDWTHYSVHDAGHVMILYLEQLPEPVIPYCYHQRFCQPLRKHHIFSVDSEKVVRYYQGLIAELPSVNRHVLLYVLDLLAVFMSRANINQMDTPELAALFQPSLLGVPRVYRRDPKEPQLSQDALLFLIDNQNSFPLGLQGTAMYDEPPVRLARWTDTIELDELALGGISRESALPDVQPPLTTTPTTVSSSSRPTLYMSDRDSDLKKSRDTIPFGNRTEMETEPRTESSLDDNSRRQRHHQYAGAAAATSLVRRAAGPRKRTKLAIHDKQRVYDSKFGNGSRSTDVDNSHLVAVPRPLSSASGGLQESQTTNSNTMPDFGGGEKDFVAQKRAGSSNLAEGSVLAQENNLSESILEGVRDQIVLRDSEQPSTAPANDPERNFTKRLGHYFTEGNESRVEFSESEINDISQLLLRLDPSWSRIPRVYIVLRIIGCLHAMSTFVDVGFSDYDFPVTARSLPPDLNPKARSDFVKKQTIVMTKSLNLEKREGGQHCFFKKDEYLPLRGEGILGVGGFGQVDKVLSLTSFKKYARKRVLRTAAFGGRNASAQRAFIKEIEILKRLKHWHIVEFVGSYTDHKYIAVLMEPIADMDLAAYLQRADAVNHSELRTFFGCLSRALEFLHQQNIRHKDIKPQNILYEAGRGVLLTDFGLALDFTEASRSTTIGMVNGMTPMYCAPEVAAEEPRSTSSDIYSLGIVFLEMIVVLKGHSVNYMRAYFEQHGSKNWLIRKNNEALDGLLAELGSVAVVSDNKVLTWIEQMLHHDQKLRPTAASLLTWCTLADENGIRHFSSICCLSPDESYSEASDDYRDNGFDPL